MPAATACIKKYLKTDPCELTDMTKCNKCKMKASGKSYSVINGGLFRFGTLLCDKNDRTCEISVNNCLESASSIDCDKKYLNASQAIECFVGCGISPDVIDDAISSKYPKKIICGAC